MPAEAGPAPEPSSELREMPPRGLQGRKARPSRALSRSSGSLSGRIMVGAAESVAAELVHAKRQVDQLADGRTQLTVATFASGGRLLLPGALAYHFDGPLPGRPGPNSGLEWTPLMEDPLCVVLPDAQPLAGRAALDIAELAAEPWVLGCLKTEAYLRRYAEQAGFEVEVRGTTTDYFFARPPARSSPRARASR